LTAIVPARQVCTPPETDPYALLARLAYPPLSELKLPLAVFELPPVTDE